MQTIQQNLINLITIPFADFPMYFLIVLIKHSTEAIFSSQNLYNLQLRKKKDKISNWNNQENFDTWN